MAKSGSNHDLISFYYNCNGRNNPSYPASNIMTFPKILNKVIKREDNMLRLSTQEANFSC